jgi:hypothetical protein
VGQTGEPLGVIDARHGAAGYSLAH